VTNPYGARLYQRNRRLVLAEAGGRCFWPGCRRLATTADHIVPLALGGTHDLANLRPSCRHHNSKMGADLTNAIRRGSAIGARSRIW
jgi:5-methylcytosine-specific restriction endonuclease McrA